MSLTQEQKQVLSGLKQLREDKGVTLGDLSEELGMSQGQLSMHESGVRTFRLYTLEAFAEDYRCAVEKISAFNEEYDVDREGLVWKRVTSERLEEARKMQSVGRNVIQISMKLGVDEFELEKLLS